MLLLSEEYRDIGQMMSLLGDRVFGRTYRLFEPDAVAVEFAVCRTARIAKSAVGIFVPVFCS